MKFKTAKRTALLLTALLIFSSAGGCSQSQTISVRIAYTCSSDINESSQAVGYLTKKIPAGEGDEFYFSVMQEAMSDPGDENYYSAFPNDVAVNFVKYSKGTVTVDFSAEYDSLGGITRVLADYCTVMTMFSTGDVTGVRITVEGESEDSGNLLTPDNIIYNDDELNLRTHMFTLYYPNESNSLLDSSQWSKVLSDAQNPAEIVTNALIDGNGITAFIPDETRLLSVETYGRICYVNLSSKFLSDTITADNGKSLSAYAFVNSLCELTDIDRVQILVNGDPIDGFNDPVTFDDSLVE